MHASTANVVKLGLMAGFVGVLAGCSLLQRTELKDPDAIAARYSNKYKGPCSSWIQSHRTGYYYCASPAVQFDYEADVVTKMEAVYSERKGPAGPAVDESKVDKASLMAHGEKVYGETCAVCHQANGEGLKGTFPPLKGAGQHYGKPKKHAGIILNGISGELVRNGVTYNGVMPPQKAVLRDYDIAAVATYERHSWGNNDGIVLPKHVKAAREGK